jgi:hypothetical protein
MKIRKLILISLLSLLFFGCCYHSSEFCVWDDHAADFRKMLDDNNYKYKIVYDDSLDTAGNHRGAMCFITYENSEDESYNLRLLVSDFKKKYDTESK